MKRNKQKQKINTDSIQQPKPTPTRIRQDGFANSVIGHQTKHDPYSNFLFMPSMRMNDHMLQNIFIDCSLANRTISLPADEAVKNWISVPQDKNNNALSMLEDLNAEIHFADAVRWSRLFGGSGILMMVNDGRKIDEPIDESNISNIEELRVFDKTQIWWNEAVLYEDPSNVKYGKPQYYQINPMDGLPFMVHESRLLLFTGDPVPDYWRLSNNGWGKSSLQGLIEELTNNQHSMKLAITVMERKGQAILKLSGLTDVLDLGEDGDKAVKTRLDLIDMARSILNTIAIDADDEFKIENLSISGMADLIDRFGFAYSAVSNIPFVILFGHNPKGSGLAQSGGTDLENWYNYVSQIQKRHIKNPLSRLIRLCMLAKNGLFKGKPIENWTLKFNPLWSPSDKEVAEANQLDADANFKNAQADSLMIQNKVVSVAECQRKAGYTPDEIVGINQEISEQPEPIDNKPDNNIPSETVIT